MILLGSLKFNLRKLVAWHLVFVLVMVNFSVYSQVDYQVQLQPAGDKASDHSVSQVVNTASVESVTQKMTENVEPQINEENIEEEGYQRETSEDVTIQVGSDEGEVTEVSANDFQETSESENKNNTAASQILSHDFENYESKRKSFGVHYRYLGVLSQLGVEKTLAGRFSMALYYGRYVGTVAGTDDLGFIPDLHHMALQTNIYLGREKLAMTQGPVIRFALHANQQKENELVKSVQVDGVDVIVPGQTRYGTLLGIGYSWQKNWFNVSVGAEYLSLGPLKNLVPLTVSLGVAF